MDLPVLSASAHKARSHHMHSSSAGHREPRMMELEAEMRLLDDHKHKRGWSKASTWDWGESGEWDEEVIFENRK